MDNGQCESLISTNSPKIWIWREPPWHLHVVLSRCCLKESSGYLRLTRVKSLVMFNWAHFSWSCTILQSHGHTASFLLTNHAVLTNECPCPFWISDTICFASTANPPHSTQHPHTLSRQKKHEICKMTFSPRWCMVSPLYGFVWWATPISTSFIVRSVFHWITIIPHPPLLAIRSTKCVTVAGSYYAQITFPSFYNPGRHKGKLFMICNYVF